MALIICPDCGKQFSDKAQACPQCGAPVNSAPKISTLPCEDCGFSVPSNASSCPKCGCPNPNYQGDLEPTSKQNDTIHLSNSHPITEQTTENVTASSSLQSAQSHNNSHQVTFKFSQNAIINTIPQFSNLIHIYINDNEVGQLDPTEKSALDVELPVPCTIKFTTYDDSYPSAKFAKKLARSYNISDLNADYTFEISHLNKGVIQGIRIFRNNVCVAKDEANRLFSGITMLIGLISVPLTNILARIGVAIIPLIILGVIFWVALLSFIINKRTHPIRSHSYFVTAIYSFLFILLVLGRVLLFALKP